MLQNTKIECLKCLEENKEKGEKKGIYRTKKRLYRQKNIGRGKSRPIFMILYTYITSKVSQKCLASLETHIKTHY